VRSATLFAFEDELVEERRALGTSIVEQLESHLAAVSIDPDESIATHRLRTRQREVALSVDMLSKIANQNVTLLWVIEQPSLKSNTRNTTQHHESLFASCQINFLQTPWTSGN